MIFSNRWYLMWLWYLVSSFSNSKPPPLTLTFSKVEMTLNSLQLPRTFPRFSPHPWNDHGHWHWISKSTSWTPHGNDPQWNHFYSLVHEPHQKACMGPWQMVLEIFGPVKGGGYFWLQQQTWWCEWAWHQRTQALAMVKNLILVRRKGSWPLTF